MMPASPWIGSTRKAQVLGVILSRSAWASPKATRPKPAGNGPKPWRYWASDEKPTMEIVRPWKLFSATRISVCPEGIHLTVSPHLRAAFSAVSTASAPEFIGSAISKPVSLCSSS